jgi:hypothetical protein
LDGRGIEVPAGFLRVTILMREREQFPQLFRALRRQYLRAFLSPRSLIAFFVSLAFGLLGLRSPTFLYLGMAAGALIQIAWGRMERPKSPSMEERLWGTMPRIVYRALQRNLLAKGIGSQNADSLENCARDAYTCSVALSECLFLAGKPSPTHRSAMVNCLKSSGESFLRALAATRSPLVYGLGMSEQDRKDILAEEAFLATLAREATVFRKTFLEQADPAEREAILARLRDLNATEHAFKTGQDLPPLEPPFQN